MKKVISAALIALMTLTISASNVPVSDQSTMLTQNEMTIVQGGLRLACWAAIGGMAVATAGMVAGAGSIIGFGIGFAGLCFATVALVDAC